MGLTEADMATGDLYKTQYVTWNNFGLEKADKNLTTQQIMAYILDQLDIHEGTIFRYQQACLQDDAVAADYKKDLRLLQYDLLYGERYAYGQQDLYPRSDLVMGVQDVEIEGTYIEYDKTKLSIIGKNFTPWSKVYINGERVTTSYKSGTRLVIFLKDIQDGDAITINQLGSGETIFRSSSDFIWDAPAWYNEDMAEAAEDVDKDDLIDTEENVVNTVTDEGEAAHDAEGKKITDEINELHDQVMDTLQEVDQDHLND